MKSIGFIFLLLAVKKKKSKAYAILCLCTTFIIVSLMNMEYKLESGKNNHLGIFHEECQCYRPILISKEYSAVKENGTCSQVQL